MGGKWQIKVGQESQKRGFWAVFCFYLIKGGNAARPKIPALMFPLHTPTRTAAVRHLGSVYGIPSADLLGLCQALLLARAAVSTLRPNIVAMQVAVLAEHDFQIAAHWLPYGVRAGRILDPAGAYEMSEERFAVYTAACALRYRAAGYVFADQQCPLAIAQDVAATAGKAFGLACSELRLDLGFSPQRVLECGDAWPEFLDLMLAIVVPFLNPYRTAQGSTSFRPSRF